MAMIVSLFDGVCLLLTGVQFVMVYAYKSYCVQLLHM